MVYRRSAANFREIAPMQKLRCIAVDDESLARKLLVENIRQIPFLELVATCKNAFEAMEVLEREQVDLMFLDIQMPGMLGTQLIAGLRHKPLVILVTAYPSYAVESYELEVVDYLMKPVSLERFSRAVYKAREIARQGQDKGTTGGDVNAVPESFFVNVEYALVKIVTQEITHIEGMKDYVKIFTTTAAKPILTKSSLKAMEERLPGEQFMRVHKSFIVNLSRIEAIRSHQLTIGEYELPVSEANMEGLLRALGQK